MFIAAPAHRTARFTLIELLTVIVVILILAGLLMATGSVVFTKMKKSKTQGQIQMIETALEMFRQDRGYYPQLSPAGPFTETMANDLKKSDTGRPYLDTGEFSKKDGNLTDPWGNPYYYEAPGTMNGSKFDLWSMGPDGFHGNSGSGAEADADEAQTSSAIDADDIANWKRN